MSRNKSSVQRFQIINNDFPLYDELISEVDDDLRSKYSVSELCLLLKAIFDHADEKKEYIAASIELIILHHERLNSDIRTLSKVPYGGIQNDLSIDHDVSKLPQMLQYILFRYALRCSS